MKMKWSLICNSLVCYTLNPKSGICFQFSRKRKLWSATIIIISSSSSCSSSSSVISCKKMISSNSVNKGFGAWLLNFSSFEEKTKLQTQFSNCFIRYFFLSFSREPFSFDLLWSKWPDNFQEIRKPFTRLSYKLGAYRYRQVF